MRRTFAIAGLTMLLSSSAFAVDLKGEIVTAFEHAGYAVAATDIQTVHLHLYHALNCIVGPHGDGFDAHQMNPCTGSGNGIIPDTTDATAKAKLEAAAAKAREGLATNDITAAKADATFVANTLKAMQ